MSEPTIICPNCKTEIKFTESLAAPLIEFRRRQYHKQLTRKLPIVGNAMPHFGIK